MKIRFLLPLLCLTIVACSQASREEYLLKRALAGLERIKTAEYTSKGAAYMPGDTLNKRWHTTEVKSYDNPSDTTIGACWVKFLVEGDSKRFMTAYDGDLHAVSYPDHKGVVLDDFTTRNLPFRPMTPPFFFYAKEIVRYALSTTDSIEMSVSEREKEYHMSLTIHEPHQVEFFGRAYLMPELPESMRATHDPTSHYEIWFDKESDLPTKIYRKMDHNESETTVSDVKLNTLSIDDFHLEEYYPEGYEVRMRGAKSKSKSLTPKDLVGERAPTFALSNADGKITALDNIKSKVTLLNFTGIGCGPCLQAIPMLNKMCEDFSREELEVISIESWSKPASSLTHYAKTHDIRYTFLMGNSSTLKAYHISGVPIFLLLDENHTVRYTFSGYTISESDKQIIKQINNLIGTR